MNRFAAILLLTLGLSAAALAQEHTTRRPPTSAPTPTATDNDGGWVRFTSELGRFSVLMPETPNEKTDTTPSEHGPYTTHLFIVRHDPNVFLIGWVDYDP